MAYKDVLELEKGDRIRISPNVYGTVTRRSERSKRFPDTVGTIYTDAGTITTTLPATADVVNT